jgi:polysaccharide export outer membrane protein
VIVQDGSQGVVVSFRSVAGFLTGKEINMHSMMDRRSLVDRAIRVVAQAAAVAAAAVLLGCQTNPYPPAPQSAATPDYLYKIGPLDSVNVIVWRNPELSTSVPVRPDGKITAPLIEDLPALGKDPTTLARDIETALSKYIRDPVVTVVVSGFNGPYPEQIRVVGEAQKPQALSYRQGMTLLDLMIAVGGLTDFADGNNASIMRASEGGRQYRVRLKDLIKRGDISANVDVKPGDILLIPQSWF